MRLVIHGDTLALLSDETETCTTDQVFAEASKVFLRTKVPVSIDFSGLDGLNSVTVMQWIKSLVQHQVPVNYVNAPVWLIDLFSSVTDFFAANSTVSSLQVPFYDSNTDQTVLRTLGVGQEIPILETYRDFDFSNLSPAPNLEIDVDVKSYFNFLSRLQSSLR